MNKIKKKYKSICNKAYKCKSYNCSHQVSHYCDSPSDNNLHSLDPCRHSYCVYIEGPYKGAPAWIKDDEDFKLYQKNLKEAGEYFNYCWEKYGGRK